MTSILSRILPGPKTKTSARLEAARSELERRKGELAKAEKAKTEALGQAREKLGAANATFEGSGSAEDAERVTLAEQSVSALEAQHSRTLSRLRESVEAHASTIGALEKEVEAESLVSAFGARHDAILALPAALEKLVEKLPTVPELPIASPEIRALAQSRLDALSPSARRAVEITGFGGLGAFELAPRRQELLALADHFIRAGQRLGAIAVASGDLEMLRARVDAPNQLTKAAE